AAQACQHPRLLRIRSPPGVTDAGRLRTDLGCRPRLDGARRFALGHAKLLSRASAQQRAAGLAQQRAPTTKPRGSPICGGGGGEKSRSGSASVITTHALFARKVQRKLSNGVAGFAAAGPPSDRKRSRPIRAFSATPRDGQRPCRTLAEDPGRTQPRAAHPGAAAQTRVVSMAAIRLGSWESARAFKGIICDDISEFESATQS